MNQSEAKGKSIFLRCLILLTDIKRDIAEAGSNSQDLRTQHQKTSHSV
jgi:hypothetical protein